MNMYIMILSIMYYFTNFGDLCDSGSFYLYGFPGSTTQYDRKFILLLLTSFISEIKYSYSCHWHPFSPTIDPHTVLRPTTQWSCATNSTTSPPPFSPLNHKLKLHTCRNEQHTHNSDPPVPPFKPPFYTTSSPRIASLWQYPANYGIICI